MGRRAAVNLDEHSSIVAPRLLGSILHGPNGSGRIVEVEAYGSADDPASHGHKGVTQRTKTVFGPTGHLYVYLSYGIHSCANVVTGPEDEGQAVLIRAVEPVEITADMAAARSNVKRKLDISNGPGKLCQALGIELEHDGVDLCNQGSVVRLEFRELLDAANIATTTRIGISKAVDKPLRFTIANNQWVSQGSRV